MYKRIRHILSTILVLITISIHLGFAQQYASEIDSLSKLLTTTNIEDERIHLLNELSFAYRRTSADSMLLFAKQAYNLAKKNEVVLEKKARALKNMGIAHYKKSSHIDTITKYYLQSLNIAEEIDDYYTQAACYNNIALAYMQQNKNSETLKYFLEGIAIFDTYIKKPRPLKALMLGNAGSVFAINGDREKALEYIEKSIKLADKYNYKRVLSICLDNYATELYFAGRRDEAIAALDRALKLQKQEGDLQSQIQTLVAYSDIYTKEQNFASAEQYALEALVIAQKQEQVIEICKVFNMLSDIKTQQGELEAAKEYANQSLLTAAKSGNLRFQLTALKQLSKLAKSQEEYKEALYFSERASAVEDSTNNQFTNQHRIELEARYKADERERKIKNLESEKDRQKLIAILLGFVLLAIFTSLVWFNNRTLTEKNIQLERAKEEALKASRIKQEFLSTMSHEIRTPMNGVIGFTDILLEESPRQDQLSMLQNLKTSGVHLMSLINDILDLSKLEAKKVELEFIPFHLETLLKEIVEMFRVSKKNEAVELQLELTGTAIDKLVVGDPVRLNQVLSNLISNALKFTKKGSVRVQVHAEKPVGQNQQIRFAVVDTGIGIPLEKQQLIFENFSQASSSTTRQFGGTGLGLSITRELLELMNSNIELKSTVNQGSTFKFKLQFAIGKSIKSHIPKTQFNYSNHQLPDCRILLAEDNLFNQKISAKILENLNAEVVVVPDGQLAIEALNKDHFDIVLIDLNMPVLDGWETIRHIRNSGFAQQDVPIIALTAEITHESISRLKAIDISHVAKPIHPQKLYEGILDSLQNVKHLS